VNRTTIIHADVMQGLRLLPDEAVHMVMTSPPYWGQRDYQIAPSVWGGDPAHNHTGLWRQAGTRHRGGPSGKSHARAGRDNKQRDAVGDIRLGEFCACGAWRGQLGLEPTIGLYVEHVVDVFREVRRVLRKDGTFWLNVGDTYSTSGRGGNPTRTSSTLQGGHGSQEASMIGRITHRIGESVKNKELCLIPEKLIVALQEDGWWVRRDIIWAKDTCMPESARDRPTTAHEYLWLLTKHPKYYYDALAIAEPSSPDTHARMKRAHAAYQAPGQDPQRGAAGPRANTNRVNPKVRIPSGWDVGDGHHHGKRGRYKVKQNESFHTATNDLTPLRNKRSVWKINPEPFAEAHFATFPTKLVEPCILAGTSEKGVCRCGAPYVRLVRKTYLPDRACRTRSDERDNGFGHQDARGLARSATVEEQTLGWRPSCKCDVRGWALLSARVLDPFGGAGTVGLVANRLQRDAILIEIKPEYVEMARKRITADAPLLSDVQILKGDTDGKEAHQETKTESGTGSRVLSATA